MAVYFYGCITLDGYMAAKGHGLDWLYDTGSPEETSYDEFYSHMDVTLMGRRTFQEIEKTGDPASVYPTTETYVFTHRELSCPGFTAVNGDPVEFVKGLGQDRSHLGGGRKYHSCPSAGPGYGGLSHRSGGSSAVRRGIPLFTQKEAMLRFRLETVRQYGQFAELVYGRR